MVRSMITMSNNVEVFGTTLLTKALRINAYTFLVTSIVLSTLLRPTYVIAKEQLHLPNLWHVHLIANIQTKGGL